MKSETDARRARRAWAGRGKRGVGGSGRGQARAGACAGGGFLARAKERCATRFLWVSVSTYVWGHTHRLHGPRCHDAAASAALWLCCGCGPTFYLLETGGLDSHVLQLLWKESARRRRRGLAWCMNI